MNPEQYKDNKFTHSPPTLESLQNTLPFQLNHPQNLNLPMNNTNFLNGGNKPQNYMGLNSIIIQFDDLMPF